MSTLELVEQLRQLSRADKFSMMQFLMVELAREEGINSLDKDRVHRVWSPYDYSDAAGKLMSVLEEEDAKDNAKC